MKKNILAFLIFLLSDSIMVYAEIPAFYGEKTFEYASDRLKNGDYYRAITEFKRYAFFGNDEILVKKSMYMIGLSYLKGGEYKNARNVFQLIAEDIKEPFCEDAFLRLGDVEFLIENEKVKVHKHYEFEPVYFSEVYYSRYLTKFPDGKHYSEAWTKLVFVNLLNFNFYQTLRLINSYDKNKITPDDARVMEEFKEQLKNASEISERSKTLAIIMSVLIPGAGQIYAGETGAGLLALLVNVFFAASSIYTYSNYSKLLGIVIGYYELSFYLGNIANAGNAVDKYNENERNRFRKTMIELYYKKF